MSLLHQLNELEESCARTARLVAEVRRSLFADAPLAAVPDRRPPKSTAPLPVSVRAEMEKLFAKGASVREVARATGAAPTSVHRYRKRWETKAR